jgi:hypothetical protein
MLPPIDPGTAAFLVGQAGRLVGSVWKRTRENLEQEAADELTSFIREKFMGRPAAEPSVAEPPGEGKIEAEEAAAQELVEDDRAQAEELQEKFGVQLSSALPRELTGTDASLVRAYEAVLWRLAVLASWERRAVAVSGALQGRGWITLCAPGDSKGVVAPADIWRPEAGSPALRRPWHDVPVEFFVRPLGDGASIEGEVDAVNDELSRDGFDPTQPAGADDVDVWHRIDALQAVWSALQPDAETEAAALAAGEVKFDGVLVGRRHLDTSQPLRYKEYPASWKPLLDVDKVDGLDALIDGVDKFAAKSQAVSDAVEGLFGADIDRS